VLDCGPEPPFARLLIGTNPFHATLVDLMAEVVNLDEAALAGALYEWSFGDGTYEVTDVPFVSHSYEDSLQPSEDRARFDASVAVQLSEGTTLQGRKTVSIWNPYAAARQRGLIQPRVASQSGPVRSGTQLSLEYTLRNIEEDPIRLTSREARTRPCSPDLDPATVHRETLSRVLNPGEDVSDTLVLDVALLPVETCGIALHLAGEAGPKTEVGTDIYYQIDPDTGSTLPVTDQSTLDWLNDLVLQGLVTDPDHVSDEELYRLAHEGRTSVPFSGTAAQTTRQLRAASSTADDEDPIGGHCDRGDEPPAGWEDRISCQATAHWNRYPPYIANALKGDVLLVSGCGFVGQMLRQLSPPQTYIHTGIMTRNYVEIAHSTSTDQRAANEKHARKFPWPSIKLDILKYGWPGAIRESVETAFSRTELTDPEGDTYWFHDFGAEPTGCNVNDVVPPLVIKPPAADAQSVRPILQAAADIAIGQSTPVNDGYSGSGIGNYRFYAYTDGHIGFRSSYDHPPGQRATVCSSFVWGVLKQAGVDLEGPTLETKDVEAGALVDDWTPDGHYLYPEPSRRNAGQFMWDTAHDQVMAKSSFDALYDAAADAIANQLVNCFAFDTCTAFDVFEQDWKNPGVGRTVSPDNILFWDPPTDADEDGDIELGTETSDDYGAYGYSERLVFRSGGWKRAYQWAPSAGTGVVSGVVLHEDEPVADASVVLDAAGGLETASGSDGSFTFVAIPAGTYDIEARKQLPDVFLSSRDQVVTVEDGEIIDIELLLLPPAEEFRLVSFSGRALVTDQETWAWPICETISHDGWVDVFGFGCRVSKYDPEPRSFYWAGSCCCGSAGTYDACLQISGTCAYLDDGSVEVKVTTALAGEGESTTRTVTIPADEEAALEGMYATSRDKVWGCSARWDKATTNLTLTNEVQNY
jgi:hypothetical protein